MSTQLFILPTTLISLPLLGNVTVPKYSTPGSGLPLDGKSYAAMPFGIEGVVLVAADPNAVLSAEIDVLTFPSNLDQQMTSSDVSSMITFLENLSVPANGILATSVTYRQALKVIAGAFQFAQRLAGQSGQPIFNGTGITLNSTFANLSANSQTALVSAAQVFDMPVPALAATASTSQTVAPAQTTSTQGTQITPSPVVPIDPSNLSASSSIRDVLIAAGQSWGSQPLFLNRGDGFQI